MKTSNPVTASFLAFHCGLASLIGFWFLLVLSIQSDTRFHVVSMIGSFVTMIAAVVVLTNQQSNRANRDNANRALRCLLVYVPALIAHLISPMVFCCLFPHVYVGLIVDVVLIFWAWRISEIVSLNLCALLSVRMPRWLWSVLLLFQIVAILPSIPLVWVYANRFRWIVW